MNIICSRCKREKNSSDFVHSKSAKNGFDSRCKKCHAENQRKAYKLNPKRLLENSKRWRIKNKHRLSSILKKSRIKQKEKNPLAFRAHEMFQHMRQRSKSKNRNIILMNPNITPQYILSLLTMQYSCGCCSKAFDFSYRNNNKKNPNAPSIDRIDNLRGYEKNNIVVICWRCNSIKNDGTEKEHFQIASWMHYMKNGMKNDRN